MAPHKGEWLPGYVNVSHEGVRPAAFLLINDCRGRYIAEVDPADEDEWGGFDCREPDPEKCHQWIRTPRPPAYLRKG